MKAKALRGSAWAVISYGTSQAIRLSANLILTRMMVPEAFGLMAIVTAVMVGLQSFSDVGIQVTVVQRPEGSDPDFLDTAWSLQIVRGLLIWVLSCCLAFPLAKLYSAPSLIGLIPAVGATAFIAGFQTTSIHTANRTMVYGRLACVEVVSQVAGLIIMIQWALWDPSVWALAVGSVIASIAQVVLGHMLLPGHRPRFHIYPQHARTIVTFGKWLLLSTIGSFAIGLADRLVVGALANVSVLGIYSIAAQLAAVPLSVSAVIAGRVLFPAYASIYRERDRQQLSVFARRAASMLYLIVTPVFVAVILFGPKVIDIMYDSRYRDAGHMLRLLAAVGAANLVINVSAAPFLALGLTSFQATLQGVRTATFALAAVAGLWSGSLEIFLIAVTVASYSSYLLIIPILRRTGVLHLDRDLMSLGVSLGALLFSLSNF